MSCSDIECPYCGKGQDVCHDDGLGYAEDVAHEMRCEHCDKNFTFQTSVMFCYSPSKADCLNGSEHKLEQTRTFPARYTKMRCTDCDYERQPTEQEFKNILKGESNDK